MNIYEEKFNFLRDNGYTSLAAYRALGYTKEALKDPCWIIRSETYRKLGYTREALNDENWHVKTEAESYFRAKKLLKEKEVQL